MVPPTKVFTVIPDSVIDPDSPVTTTLMTNLRDNDIHLEEWLGANFIAAQNHDHDGINSKGVSGANWQFVERILVSTPVSQLQFSGLDGNTDEYYRIVFRGSTAGGVAALRDAILVFNGNFSVSLYAKGPLGTVAGGHFLFTNTANLEWFYSEILMGARENDGSGNTLTRFIQSNNLSLKPGGAGVDSETLERTIFDTLVVTPPHVPVVANITSIELNTGDPTRLWQAGTIADLWRILRN